MGFAEVPHTADVAVHVWAVDLPSLFAEAARGLNFVAGAVIGPGPRRSRSLRLVDADDEGLLVSFLTELVYAQEQEHMAYDEFDLHIVDHRLTGHARGATLAALAKPIKAVTFHNIGIHRTERGLEVQVVLDV